MNKSLWVIALTTLVACGCASTGSGPVSAVPEQGPSFPHWVASGHTTPIGDAGALRAAIDARLAPFTLDEIVAANPGQPHTNLLRVDHVEVLTSIRSRENGVHVAVTRISERGNSYPDAISVFTYGADVPGTDGGAGMVGEEQLSLVKRARAWGHTIPFTEVQIFDSQRRDTYTYIDDEWYLQSFSWSKAETPVRYLSPDDIVMLHSPPVAPAGPRFRR